MTNRCKNRLEYTLQELAERLGGTVLGDGQVRISGVAGLKEAGPGDITFLANPRYQTLLHKSRASALITSSKEPLFNGSILKVSDPYLGFAMVLEIFHPPAEPVPGIHPDAHIEPDAKIGEGASVQAGAVIGHGVYIGRGAQVMSCTVVGEASRIGDYSCLYPNVTLYPRTQIGKRVIIHAGSVIGSDGFGYARKGGLPYKVLQVGRVVIEDECEIGANVTIDRGTLGDTRIGKGTKIDNLVQIGHNVVIGPYSVIVSQVGISGSTQIGQGVVLAGQVGVAGHIKIGENVTVAARSGVTKDVLKGETIAGFMAMPISQWRRSEAVYRRLPGLQKGYRELMKKVEALEARLKSGH